MWSTRPCRPTSPPAALTDYADFIAYAAGQGQTAGSAPGDLPPGYLPLTASLQAQAQSVVTQLEALAGATRAHGVARPTATSPPRRRRPAAAQTTEAAQATPTSEPRDPADRRGTSTARSADRRRQTTTGRAASRRRPHPAPRQARASHRSSPTGTALAGRPRADRGPSAAATRRPSRLRCQRAAAPRPRLQARHPPARRRGGRRHHPGDRRRRDPRSALVVLIIGAAGADRAALRYGHASRPRCPELAHSGAGSRTGGNQLEQATPLPKGLAGELWVRRPRNTRPCQYQTAGYTWASPSGYVLRQGEGKTSMRFKPPDAAEAQGPQRCSRPASALAGSQRPGARAGRPGHGRPDRDSGRGRF